MATVELKTISGGEMESYEFPGKSTAQALGLGMAAAEDHFDAPVDGAGIIVTAYGPVGEIRQGRVTWNTTGEITWEVTGFGAGKVW